jgi:Domain of unknown function (DUF4263)
VEPTRQREWQLLIDSDDSRDEQVLQRFLESNPAFLPGARTLDGTSGKDPWPYAAISQPRLPALSTKVPDFMWIAHDSAFLYPILIEIETPWKQWFHRDKLAQHSDLTTPLTQVAHWRRWFNKGRNHVNFYDYYRIPRDLQDLALRPRYVVIHGRRSEASQSPAAIEFRSSLAISEDTHLMTFDRLTLDPRAAKYFTVSADEHGFHIHPNSPAVDPNEVPDYMRHEIAGLTPEGSLGADRGYRFHPPRRRQHHQDAGE